MDSGFYILRLYNGFIRGVHGAAHRLRDGFARGTCFSTIVLYRRETLKKRSVDRIFLLPEFFFRGTRVFFEDLYRCAGARWKIRFNGKLFERKMVKIYRRCIGLSLAFDPWNFAIGGIFQARQERCWNLSMRVFVVKMKNKKKKRKYNAFATILQGASDI